MHHRPVRAIAFFAGTVSIAAFMLPTRGWAGIYEWEWIDSSDHSLGRQQSDTLCPDGAGHDAVPGAALSSLDLTQAWLHAENLSNADLDSAVLTIADLTEANLTHTSFRGATLTGADLGQSNAADADFYEATLTGASLDRAALRDASLGRAELTGANLSQADLTRASLWDATVTDVDFTGTIIRKSYLAALTGFTATQLYSTASYQSGDLAGTRFSYNNMTGWDFSGKNLAKAHFDEATLTAANLSQANLPYAQFWKAALDEVDFRQERCDTPHAVGHHPNSRRMRYLGTNPKCGFRRRWRTPT